MCQHVHVSLSHSPTTLIFQALKILPLTLIHHISYSTLLPSKLNSIILFLSTSSALCSSTISPRMRNLSSLKQEFLRKWIKGLRKYNSQKKNMNLLERKKAIKLSADLAMASTKDKNTLWRKAFILANTSTNKDEQDSSTSPQNKVINMKKNMRNSYPLYRKRIIGRCRKMLRKHPKERVKACFIATCLVKKRTRRLKSLLPGGKFMDDGCLVDETLDYIQSLKAQVEVMRSLVSASELFINKF